MNIEAYLLDGKRFEFVGIQPEKSSDKYQAAFKIILDSSKVSKSNESEEGNKLWNILRDFLDRFFSEERTLALSLQNVDLDRWGRNCTFSIKIEGNILFHLMCLLGDELRLQVEISDAEVEIPSPRPDQSELVISEETSYSYGYQKGGSKFPFFEVKFKKFPKRWHSFWNKHSLKFFGTLNIKLGGSLVLKPESVVVGPPKSEVTPALQLENIKKMMSGQIEMDVVLVAGDGKEFRTHSAVSISHSPVLKTMLTGKFKEGQTKRVEMKQMSSSAVQELLAFLYYWDLDKASEKFYLAVELLECAHAYSIEKLEADVKSIILSKGTQWMDVNGAMRLFFFSRNIPTLSDVEKRAISFIKRDRSRLLASKEYDWLFKKEPESFRILVNALILSDD